MDKLLLHPTTAYQYRALAKTGAHAVLITGPSGSGKETLARSLAQTLMQVPDTAEHPFILELRPDEKGTLTIDAVRRIRDFLKRKTTGTQAIRRAVILLDTQAMSDDAQNALLKTLEEPPQDTVIILTCDQLTNLKQTIRSRAQQLVVLPVDKEAALKFFDSPGVERAYYMSDGRVGLLASLLSDSEDHELVHAINQAKRLLQFTPYERLLEVDSLSKQKSDVFALIEGLERVMTSLLRQAADKDQVHAVRKAYRTSKLIQRARKALLANGNTKLILTDLFLNI